MIPAEQGQERADCEHGYREAGGTADCPVCAQGERVWTIYEWSRPIGGGQLCRVDGPMIETGNPVEVVPAADKQALEKELEMEAVEREKGLESKLRTSQKALAITGRALDLCAAERQALEAALVRIATFPIDVTNAGHRTLNDLKALRLVAYGALDQLEKKR